MCYGLREKGGHHDVFLFVGFHAYEIPRREEVLLGSVSSPRFWILLSKQVRDSLVFVGVGFVGFVGFVPASSREKYSQFAI